MKRKLSADSGFTLIETLVCLAIASLLFVAAALSVSTKNNSDELRRSAARLVELFESAKIIALKTGSQQNVTFNRQMRAWTIDGLPMRVDIPLNVTQQITTVAPLSSSDTLSMAFFPSGGNSGGEVLLKSTDSSISIELGWLSGTISFRSNSEKP